MRNIMMYVVSIMMVAILFLTLIIVMQFSLSLRKNVMHNKCHTDNMKIEDLHGHTEPHV